MRTPVSTDGGTRERLLEVAAEAFAQQGFRHVTVRALCEAAGVNLASVNYHFRSKLDLYRELVDEAIAGMDDLIARASAAGEGLDPEGRLEAYVRVHCEQLFAGRTRGTIRPHQLQLLLMREVHEPTPELVPVIDCAVRRRAACAGAILAPLLGRPPDDPAVLLCSVSIHAQIVGFRPNPVRDRQPGPMRQAFERDRVVAHIVRFSLAGIRAARGEA